MPSIKVIFEPTGRWLSAKSNATIMAIAKEGGINLRSDCGGKGTCGKCRVQISPSTALTPFTEAESLLLSEKERTAGFRLACQAYLAGSEDIVVTIPSATQDARRRILIQGFARSLQLNPAIQSILIKVPSVDPAHPEPDTTRLVKALSTHFVGKLPRKWKYPLSVISKTPKALRSAHGQVTLIIRNKSQILDIHPGDAQESIYGVAIDIGTSKLVGSLFSLKDGRLIASLGIENPQLRFGEDIMTRLSYAMVSPETAKELQSVVVEAIGSMLNSFSRIGIQSDAIYELVIAGNTAMTSLLLAVDTTHLSYGPFTLPFRGPLEISTHQLGLPVSKNAIVYVLPNIAGYVGADAVADILTAGLYRQRNPCLLIDIGTNSEVILGNRNRIVATSCAAGPAFEGAHIEHGMKAISGAIERVSLDPETMTYQLTTVDSANPIGICGSGAIDVIAELANANFISSKGRFTKSALPLLQTEYKKRFIILSKGKKGSACPQITFSEQDISQILLAKAAIQTGYTLLLDYQNLKINDIERVFIAGAFGNYLNLANAQRIGLIPPVSLRKVTFIGNAALTGAQLTLLSTFQRRNATRIAETTKFVDLARHPNFTKTYSASLFI